jgi:hypothetical protein
VGELADLGRDPLSQGRAALKIVKIHDASL